MKEEILTRIDALAAKLGVAADHLWEILTQQGIVVGIYGFSTAIIGSILCYFCIKGFSNMAEKYSNAGSEDDGKYWAMSWVYAILGIVSGIVAIGQYFQTRYLFNPEYYAYVKILALITGTGAE